MPYDAEERRILDEATKECPDCAEEVKAAARRCRFCGYYFEPPEPRDPDQDEQPAHGLGEGHEDVGQPATPATREPARWFPEGRTSSSARWEKAPACLGSVGAALVALPLALFGMVVLASGIDWGDDPIESSLLPVLLVGGAFVFLVAPTLIAAALARPKLTSFGAVTFVVLVLALSPSTPSDSGEELGAPSDQTGAENDPRPTPSQPSERESDQGATSSALDSEDVETVETEIQVEFPEAERASCYPEQGDELVCRIQIAPTPANPGGGVDYVRIRVRPDGSWEPIGPAY
jgi:hypothetical protein